MLATLGFLTIGLLLALILSKRATPLVALVVVPLVGGVIAGQATALGGYVTTGLQETAPVAAMFVFAIIYFGVMSDAGMLDPAVDGVLRLAGFNPVRIVVGSAVLGALLHLDGSGATTFLIAIPALLPLYERLGMDRRILACVVAMAAGTMNIVPWGGPLLRAAAALRLPVSDLFMPLLPVVAVGLAAVMGIAYWMGRREAWRLASVRTEGPADRAELGTGRVLTEAQLALRRPDRLGLNLGLTVLVLVPMVGGWVPPALAFMVGTVIALSINYPEAGQQRRRVDAHANAALMMATILLAAGVFTGVLKGTGMLEAMASAAAGAVPSAMAPHIPVVLGLVAMPLSLMFDPDSFYLGMLPVIAEVAGSYGVPSVQIGQAALLGQMTTGFPVSPLTPATYLLIGLTGIDLAEHQRFTMPWLFGLSVLMTLTALALGVFAL